METDEAFDTRRLQRAWFEPNVELLYMLPKFGRCILDECHNYQYLNVFFRNYTTSP